MSIENNSQNLDIFSLIESISNNTSEIQFNINDEPHILKYSNSSVEIFSAHSPFFFLARFEPVSQEDIKRINSDSNFPFLNEDDQIVLITLSIKTLDQDSGKRWFYRMGEPIPSFHKLITSKIYPDSKPYYFDKWFDISRYPDMSTNYDIYKLSIKSGLTAEDSALKTPTGKVMSKLNLSPQMIMESTNGVFVYWG